MSIVLAPGRGITASIIPSAPFNSTAVSSFSGPRIALPISLSLII